MIKNFISFLTLKCKKTGRYNESCYFFANTYMTLLICLNLASLLILLFKKNASLIEFSKSDYFMIPFFIIPACVFMTLSQLYPKHLVENIEPLYLEKRNIASYFIFYLFISIALIVVAALV